LFFYINIKDGPESKELSEEEIKERQRNFELFLLRQKQVIQKKEENIKMVTK
jgi:hypothetical protein